MTEELVSLSHKELDRVALIERVDRRELSQVDAAALAGCSSRQLRRWLVRSRESGAAGLISRHQGKSSNNRLSNAVREQIARTIADQYADFGPTLANEMLTTHHDIQVSTESVRQLMIGNSLWRARHRRQTTHPLRDRRPRRGEMVQIDGSPHDWFEGRGPRCTLIVFIDDATSELMSLQFWPQETTEAYMSVLGEYLQQHGRPVSVYSDRHGIFRAPVDTELPQATQFGRVLQDLEIESILANSPQAKGRVERVNRTLQDRLVKMMRLRGIDSIDQANDYLAEFIEVHNQRFATCPLSSVDAHRPVQHSEEELDIMMSYQDRRQISKNLEVRYANKVYQIDAPNRRRRLSGKHAIVCAHYDGRVSILVNGENMNYEVYQKGEQPSQVEDTKTVNKRVDQAVKRHQPDNDHPWKKMPATEGGFKQQARST